MAKVHALMKFTDPSGVEHEIGDEFDLPRNTDEEKRAFGQLLDYGVVTQSESKAHPKSDSEDSESGQRTRRTRN